MENAKRIQRSAFEVYTDVEDATSPISLVTSLLFHIVQKYNFCNEDFDEHDKLALLCERKTIGDMLILAINQLNTVYDDIAKIKVYKESSDPKPTESAN